MNSPLDDRIRRLMQRAVSDAPQPPRFPMEQALASVPDRRASSWVVAVGSAAAAIVLIGGAAWMFGGDDVAPVRTEAPAPETTAPPTASSTTVVPAAEAPGASEVTTTTVWEATTTTIPPVPTSLGSTWERVPAAESLENGWMAAVIEGVPGLVAVGGTDDGFDARVWMSADGVAWSRVESDAFGGDGYQAMIDVVSSPLGLVAVGYDEDQAAVWLSPDGNAWSRVPGNEDAFAAASMDRIAVGGPGLVAVGNSEDDAAAFWVSADALTWTRVLVDDRRTTVVDVTAHNGLLVAVGYSNHGSEEGTVSLFPVVDLKPEVWFSSDGLSWERLANDAIPTGPGTLGDYGGWMQAVTGSDDGLVAVGSATWTSVDGSEWTLAGTEFYSHSGPPLLLLGGSATVTAAGSRLVATFVTSDILWASEDGGTTWHESAEFDGGFLEVAERRSASELTYGTLTHVIRTANRLVAVGSFVEWSSTEDIGGRCNQDPGDGSLGSCRSDAAIWIGTWNEE